MVEERGEHILIWLLLRTTTYSIRDLRLFQLLSAVDNGRKCFFCFSETCCGLCKLDNCV